MDTQLPPLRDYSESELLALPADSRLLFADNVRHGLLTYDNPPPSVRRRRVLQPRNAISPPLLQAALLRVRALRCLSHGISTFALYPTTDQQHAVNRFLWRAANNYSFEAREAAQLFQRNVFVVCMPSSLFDFLTSVTWEQLENAILFVLTNLAQASRGMSILHEELAPCLVKRLDEFAALPDQLAHVDTTAFRLMLDLLMDRIVCMGAWVVPTTLCYLSASDMTELLARRYERSIFSTPEKFELVHTMMWNIYRDWQTYRHVLVKNGARTRLQALELMAKTISKGTQEQVHQGITTLYNLASALHPPHRTYFSLLPMDLILCKLMPNVCEAYAMDQKENTIRRSSSGAASSRRTSEQPSSVTVPFSLKSWVLENHVMNKLYNTALESDQLQVDTPPGGSSNENAQQESADEPQELDQNNPQELIANEGNTLQQQPQEQQSLPDGRTHGGASGSPEASSNTPDMSASDIEIEGCTNDTAPHSASQLERGRTSNENSESTSVGVNGDNASGSMELSEEESQECNNRRVVVAALTELGGDHHSIRHYRHGRDEDNAAHIEEPALSPRTLRRRLNEQGCFERISDVSIVGEGSCNDHGGL